jgi:hypothetical protein
MKRTPMKRAKPMRQRRREGADIEREQKPRAERIAAQAPPKTLHAGTYAGSTKPAPKTKPWRCAAIMEMARGRRCLFQLHGICNWDWRTTVACHRNEGKGMAQKQSDEFTCWGCATCHRWYDEGQSARAYKRQVFMEAHLRQVLAWRAVVVEPSEPMRFRKAAAKALERLNATPLPEAPE